MASRDRVVLIDGSAFLYRAFFAIPGNLTTSTGIPTNAVYGFAAMFRKLFAGRRPRYGAVIFDAPGRTFRDERFPAYKAQRPRMPAELRAQLALVDELVSAHGFPVLRLPGYEADDVIGTLVRRARSAGHEVHIYSGDKDFTQLIDDSVRMIDSLREVTWDAEVVRKRWGVSPRHIVDLFALVGDKADNVPGVPGIGLKGAVQLLERYGSLDGVYARVDEVKGSKGNALREHRDLAYLSRDLITIDQHVPLETGVDELELPAQDHERLGRLYRELQFFSLLEDTSPVTLRPLDEEIVRAMLRDGDEVAAFLASLSKADSAGLVAVVDEGPHGQRDLIAVALWSAATGGACFSLVDEKAGLEASGREALRHWLADGQAGKVVHDVKHLLRALDALGWTLAGVVADTQLASFLVDPTRAIPHGLPAVAKEYLQQVLPLETALLGAGKQLKQARACEPEAVAAFALERAKAVSALWPVLDPLLREAGLDTLLRDVELPLAHILFEMERRGIAVDGDDLHALGVELRQQLERYKREARELAGRSFNLSSPRQVGEVLFDQLKLPVKKRTRSGYSTDAEVLERLRAHHPIAAVLLEHRRLAKLITTYTDVLQGAVDPRCGRIHATFQQTAAATGRLGTTEPDLQKTPVRSKEGQRIRRAFRAPAGQSFVVADWNQIELRLLAHFADDTALSAAFSSGVDVHRQTAAELFGVSPEAVSREQRDVGKTVNFATLYGQGATALSQQLGVSRAEAKGYIERYFHIYAGVASWIEGVVAEAYGLGYVTTLLGRRRYLPLLSSRSVVERQAGERIAANTVIQGSAADLCKLAMLQLADELFDRALPGRLLLQVHDELVVEAQSDAAPEVARLVRGVMQGVGKLRVPLVVEVGIGPSWGEAKSGGAPVE